MSKEDFRLDRRINWYMQYEKYRTSYVPLERFLGDGIFLELETEVVQKALTIINTLYSSSQPDTAIPVETITEIGDGINDILGDNDIPAGMLLTRFDDANKQAARTLGRNKGLPLNSLEIRGSSIKIAAHVNNDELNLDRYKSPNRLMRDVGNLPDDEQTVKLGISPDPDNSDNSLTNLTRNIIRMIQSGPNLDIRIRNMQRHHYGNLAQLMKQIDKRKAQIPGSQKIHTTVIEVPLDQINDPRDDRKVYLIEIWGRHNYPELTLTLVALSGGESFDSRADTHYSLESVNRSRIKKGAIRVPPDLESLYVDNLLTAENGTQTLGNISRFVFNNSLLDTMRHNGKKVTDDINAKPQITEMTMADISDPEFWSDYLLLPWTYEDICKAAAQIFNFENRNAEIISRLTLGYYFDPYRCIAMLNASGLLNYMQLANVIKNEGTIDPSEEGGTLENNSLESLSNWLFGQYRSVFGTDQTPDLLTALSELSDNYRKNIFPTLNLDNCPWFNGKYLGIEKRFTFNNLVEQLVMTFPEPENYRQLREFAEAPSGNH